MNYQIIFPKGYKRLPLPTKAKWTQALRSGLYKQGEDKLYYECNNSYCCLGVLSKIQGRLYYSNDGDIDSDGCCEFLSSENPLNSYLKSKGNLPEEVFVINNDNNLEYNTLVSLNDVGFSFNNISDIIDAIWYDPEFENANNYDVLIN